MARFDLALETTVAVVGAMPDYKLARKPSSGEPGHLSQRRADTNEVDRRCAFLRSLHGTWW
eukprot:CAMPEP_0175906308 /NCGR_PEP_ID=MMETSP0108-20121206/5477_1 /TAXON_ID=195067 ORGANISM="Goniomonas pacifica, Strain CCMP1869" /NCGR_SAMPLE_ID=MMETSP0108 /ASSEMBLY_ACC=CAM_ASM_000204 /LENGTH=60 /DNA_ID=CAMNT_0017228251 /DNA_START=26 /DNA_END=205 /DNA_ORIENTATION=+